MNLDDRNDILPPSHHKDAKNVVFRGNPGLMQAQNVYGTRLINNPNLRSGTNVCIGSYYDSLKNRVFYFVYNLDPSDGKNYNAIFMYDVNTGGAPVRLLMSHINSTVDLFGFNQNYPITSVNILYRPDAEGDILYWTDGLNRPKKLNILEAPSKYGNNWLPQYLTVSRKVPLISPVCKYNNDSGTSINNLKNRVFQFSYRWIFTDNTKSTFSPISRLFSPADVDTISNEIDPTKNNVINVTYNSGPADAIAIEIAARQSLGTTFSDYFSVATINKIVNGVQVISNNTDYQYDFYNSQSYQFIDVAETVLLYSLVPTKANSQELLNGNQLIYGGITEGRSQTTIDVTTSTALIANTAAPKLTMSAYNRYTLGYIPPNYTYISGSYYIVLSGTPVAGDIYTFSISMRKQVGGVFSSATSTISITVTTGTQSAVETQIVNALIADSNMIAYNLNTKVTAIANNPSDPFFPNKYGVKIGGDAPTNAWILNAYNFAYTYYSAGPVVPPDPTGVNTACYKHNSRYGFGLVYFDEYGATGGVNTISAMNIITPELNVTALSTDQPTIPAITFNVSNPPPAWATSFSFVRTTNLSVDTFKTITTNKTYKDATYGYLDITDYQNNTSGYPKYNFLKGDRVRLCGKVGGSTNVKDYPVLDLMTQYLTNTGSFIKVQYDSTTMSTFGVDNLWYLEVYTPSHNTSESNTQVYYEFGETYNTYTDVNGNLAHTGQTGGATNQIIGAGAQPAVFTFYRGDIYERQRNVNWILDQSMSDFFPSQVDGLGRPFVQDPSAKETYYPTLVRYSMPYSQGTTINETNVFYAQNFDEYDRAKGDIRRLKVRGSQMRVFQSRAVGVAGVYENMIFNADGSDNLIQTNKILNQIHYYQGNYGMGWMSTSLASSASADYFVDPVRGYQLRVAQDGITPISEIYKAQYYITDLATQFVKPVAGALGGEAKILGVYDFFEEEYVAVFQPTASRANITLAFNEKRNCYSSFYDYSPEVINNIEGKVISFRSGNLYVHDDVINYNRFYGTQYPSSVTFVFNEQGVIKKDYNAITQDSNVVWTSPTVGDINTALDQDSNLVSSDYVRYEGLYNAAFMRDANSLGGLVEGDYLKGVWLEAKFSNTSSNLVYLSGIYINYTPSQRNL